MAEKLTKAEKQREGWRKALAEGDFPAQTMRRLFRLLPSSPRCGMCMAPFKGFGSIILKPLPFTTPSRKNPTWCKQCFESAPLGGAEVPTAVLFADIRGFTSHAEALAPEEVARQLNRFYKVAADVLAGHAAVIDKLVGDEVMALWVPGFAGKDYVSRAVDGAEALLRAVGFGGEGESWLPLGLGLDAGTAFVGNVGSGSVKDFTALGDVVNTASRLQGRAKPGEIVMSEAVYAAVADRYPHAQPTTVELKGKSEPVAVRVVDVRARGAA